MPLGGRLLAATLILLFVSCSSNYGPPPDLPQLALERFAPGAREQVQKAYEDAKANPQDPTANGRLGMVLHAYEQHRSAEVCYLRARALAPKDFRWNYYLGAAQAAIGKNGEAAVSLRAALRIDREYLPARMKLADVLLALGDLKESRKIYEAIATEHPESALAQYGLGRVQSAQGDPASAIEHYLRACELAPNFGGAHYGLALAYQKLGDRTQAQQHMALYQKNQLGGPPAGDPLLDEVKGLNAGALDHLKKGVSFEAAGRLEEAVAEHEKAVELNPKMTQAHVNLITLYGKLGRGDKAEEHYRATVALNPNLAESHYNFGVFLYDQGRYREAGQAFHKALDINKNYAEAHNNYAYLLEREGKLDEAIRHFRAALESNPNYRLAHFHLAKLLLHRGKSVEAIRHFRQTLAPEDENTPTYMYALAAAYARTGARSQAIRYAREARERAASLGQTQLLASIERDLRVLESGK